MRKLILFFAVILSVIVYFNEARTDNSFTAPYDFEISTPTTTTLIISFSDSNDVVMDSLSIRDASDSTWYAYVTPVSGGTSYTGTITGLTPSKAYDWFLVSERNDTTHVSNKDTLYTAYPEIENYALQDNFIEMYGARTWGTAHYESLYVSTSTGRDSTRVYWAKDNIGLQVYADGDADSCLARVLIKAGHAEPTNVLRETSILHTGLWAFSPENTAVDSFDISVAGWQKPQTIDMPVFKHWYVVIKGLTNNGNATKFLLRAFTDED